MNPIFEGKVEKGKIFLKAPETFRSYKKTFEGKKIQVILRKYKTSRSLPQNNYYFGVVVKMLADEFGYSTQEMHDALKLEFLRKTGGILETVRSTTDLTTTEFEMLLEKIRIWALTEHDVKIPLPNEIEI